MGVGKGWKITLGCGAIGAVVATVLVALLTHRLYREWREARALLELEAAVAAIPFMPPDDGVVREDRFLIFLEISRRLDPITERYRPAVEARRNADLKNPDLGAAAASAANSLAHLEEVRRTRVQAMRDLGMGLRELRWIFLSLGETPWDGPFHERPDGAIPRGEDTDRRNSEIFRRFRPEIERRFDMREIRANLRNYREGMQKGTGFFRE